VHAAAGSFQIAETRLKRSGADVPPVTAYPAQFEVSCGSAAAVFTKSRAAKATAATRAGLRIARRSPLHEPREIGRMHEEPGRATIRSDDAGIVRPVDR
jgi:hypothetical protein